MQPIGSVNYNLNRSVCCEILQNPFAGFDSIREMVRGYFFKIFRDKFRMIMISKVCVFFSERFDSAEASE